MTPGCIPPWSPPTRRPPASTHQAIWSTLVPREQRQAEVPPCPSTRITPGRRHPDADAGSYPRGAERSGHRQGDAGRVKQARREDTAMDSIRRASLLVVLAHPDDEVFHGGILAHLSERGVRVTLACATKGEA